MKSILILALFFLAGCSSFVPLEELEAQAVLTGDWTEVERRERIIARRNMRTSLACPPGTTGFCETGFGRSECRCVDSAALSAYFSR